MLAVKQIELMFAQSWGITINGSVLGWYVYYQSTQQITLIINFTQQAVYPKLFHIPWPLCLHLNTHSHSLLHSHITAMASKWRKISKKELERNISQSSRKTSLRKNFTTINNGQQSVRSQILPKTFPSTPTATPVYSPMVPPLQEDIGYGLKTDEAEPDFSVETWSQVCLLLLYNSLCSEVLGR